MAIVDEDDRSRPLARHVIGARLDDLSVRDFDERIALLEGEIARLEIAKRAKQAALDQAGSIFKS